MELLLLSTKPTKFKGSTHNQKAQTIIRHKMGKKAGRPSESYYLLVCKLNEARQPSQINVILCHFTFQILPFVFNHSILLNSILY